MRLVMWCVREEDKDTHRISMEFRLRRLDLVVAMPHLHDVRN